MANNQGDATITNALTGICEDRTKWIFNNQPIGECINVSMRNCLCGHRANNLLSYQYENKYILLGICCAKKYFTVDAKVKNIMAIHENRETRYCEVCQKMMRAGVHVLEHTHYTCYLRSHVLPKAVKALADLNEKFDKANLDQIILKSYLMWRIDTIHTKLFRGNKRWTYNDEAKINVKKVNTIRITSLSNQDLLTVDDEITAVMNGKIPDDIVGLDVLNADVYTDSGVKTLNEMLSTSNGLTYLTNKWKDGQFDNTAKQIIRIGINAKIKFNQQQEQWIHY
jgi:uncharacterized protein YunC (DUF1805 family)